MHRLKDQSTITQMFDSSFFRTSWSTRGAGLSRCSRAHRTTRKARPTWCLWTTRMSRYFERGLETSRALIWIRKSQSSLRPSFRWDSAPSQTCDFGQVTHTHLFLIRRVELVQSHGVGLGVNQANTC